MGATPRRGPCSSPRIRAFLAEVDGLMAELVARHPRELAHISDEQALDLLGRIRWASSAGVPICLECHGRDVIALAGGAYACRTCGTGFHLFSRSSLEGLRLKPAQIIRMLHLFCLAPDEMTTGDIAALVGCSYPTVAKIRSRLDSFDVRTEPFSMAFVFGKLLIDWGEVENPWLDSPIRQALCDAGPAGMTKSEIVTYLRQRRWAVFEDPARDTPATPGPASAVEAAAPADGAVYRRDLPAAEAATRIEGALNDGRITLGAVRRKMKRLRRHI